MSIKFRGLRTEGFELKNFEDLVNLKTLDFSEKRILSAFHKTCLYLWAESYEALLAVNFQDPWWVSKIKSKNMLELFDIASGNEKDVYNALLFCYAHQGSTKGLFKLTKALFGENAHVQFTLGTNELHITSNIDNLNFIKALVTNKGAWMTTDKSMGLLAETFEQIGTSQISLFLQGFMNPAKKVTLQIIHQ